MLAFFFRKGLSLGFQSAQKREASFVDCIANAITQGWVFLIPALIPYLIVFIVIGFINALDIEMDVHTQFLLFFGGGTAVLIITPGVYVAKKVSTLHPSISKETVVSVGIVWALALPISVVAGILTGFGISSIPSVATSSALLMAVFFFFISLIFSKAMSKRISNWLLEI